MLRLHLVVLQGIVDAPSTFFNKLLECPECGAQMRVIALIEDPTVIERILTWLGLWEPLLPVGPSPPAGPSLPLIYHPLRDIA